VTRRRVKEPTARQIEVLKLVAEGHTEVQIADALHITKNTVRGYKRVVFEKLDALCSSHAVAIAFRKGILE